MGARALVGRNIKSQKRKRGLLIFALVAMGIMCFLFNPLTSEVYASSGEAAVEASSSGSADSGGSSSAGDGGSSSAPADSSGASDSGSNDGASTEGASNGDGGTSSAPADSSDGDSSSDEGTSTESAPADNNADTSNSNEDTPAENTSGGAGDDSFPDPTSPDENNPAENGVGASDPESTNPDENIPAENSGEKGLPAEDSAGESDPEATNPTEDDEDEGLPAEACAGGAEPDSTNPDENIPAENFVDPYGTVYDAITKQAIAAATVILEQWDAENKVFTNYGDKGEGQPFVTSNGKYNFDLVSDYDYRITASASGYLDYTWNFSQEDNSEHKIDFYLVPVTSGISSGWASFDNKVTINHDIYTYGHDIEIRAPDGRGEGANKEAREDAFESITLSDGKTISTRQLETGGNHDSATSTGNSGSIKMWSPNITIGEGAQLLAHVVNEGGTTFTAGDITLEALAGAGTDVLDILVANVDHPKTSIIVSDNAILKGKIVTLTAKSDCTHINVPEAEELELAENDTEEEIEDKLEQAGIVDMGTEFMQDLLQTLPDTVHSALEGFNLIAGVAISRATALITIGEGSLIEAHSFDANSQAIIKADANPTAIGVGVAVAIGESDAQVILNGKIKTLGNCTINALADNTMVAVGNSAGIAGFSAGVAVNILSSQSRVQANNTAEFEVGGDLSLEAKTIDRTYTRASSAIAEDGKVGIAAALGIEEGVTEAYLGGRADVDGNISVQALMEKDEIKGTTLFGLLPAIKSGVNAIAGVNTNLSADVPTQAQKAVMKKITDHISGTFKTKFNNMLIEKFHKVEEEKKTPSSTFPVAGAAAMAYYQDTNKVMAYIADDAKVKSRGNVNVQAKAENQPALLSTGAAKAPKGGGSGSGGESGETGDDGAKFSGAAAVAVGLFTNEVTAYIGEKAEVDAAQDLTVIAEYINDYELKYGVELIECLTKEYNNSQQTNQTISNGDIVEVVAGHDEEKGEVGNLYKYIGTSPVNINEDTDYTDTELWENLGADWSYRRTELLKTLAANYLDTSMGLSKLPNFWIQSNASGAEVGVSGSVAVLISDNDVKAYIGKEAKINQDTDASYRTGEQNVMVKSNLVDETVTFSGNIVLPGVTIDRDNFNLSFQMGGSGTEADTAAVGASVIVFLQENEARAEIWDGVVLFADKLDVLADSKVLNVVVSAAGGEAGKFAFEGTFTLIDLDNTTVAWVSNAAKLVVEGDLTVKANDNSYIVNVAGALSESGNIGIGASIGLNTVTRSTKAIVGPGESVGYEKIEGSGEPVLGKIILNNGDMIIAALNDGFIISASVAGTVVKDKTTPKPGDSKSAPKEGEEGGNYGVGVSANVSINTIQDEIIAAIKEAALESKSTRISSGNYTQVIAVGGTVAIVTKEGTSAALSGAYAQNTITNVNKATIDDSDLVLSGDLSLEAESSEKIIAVSASGSGSTSSDSVSVAGQVSVNIISSLTEASVLNQANLQAHHITITATEKSSILAIAGALAYGGKAGIGASVAWNQIRSVDNPEKAGAVTAYIKDSDVKALGDITLKADSTNDILAVTVAAGASQEGMAAALSVSMNIIDADTQAYIIGKKSVGIDADGAITLEAINQSSILAVAGNVTYSKTASIGVAGSYNEISGTIKAHIGEENILETIVKADSLSIEALSAAYIFSVSAGGSISSGQAAVNGSVSINTINNDIGAYIQNATVEVVNSIELIAKDKSEITSIAGAVGGSQSVAVGAALAVNYIGSFGGLGQAKYVYAYIEGSQLEAKNGTITISAESESIIKSISAAGGGSSNTAVFGAVSLNFINNDIAAYIKDCSLVSAQGDISLSAADKSSIYVAAGNVAGAGTASVGAAIAISYIGNGDISSFNLYIENQEYTGNESSTTDMDYEQVDSNLAGKSKVRVYIDNSTVESLAGSLQLKALAENSIKSIAAGAAVGGTAGVQGSVSVNYSYSNVWAQILNSTITAKNDIVLEALSQGSTIQSLAGTVSGGGVAGVGIALAVNHMSNSYSASIDNSVLVSGSQGLNLTASNDASISSLSASGGGGQVGVNGSIAINFINNQVEAYLVSSTVTATQDIKLLAYDYAEIGSIAGTIAGGYYAAVGASVAVNYIGTTGNPQLVQAYILNSDVQSSAGGISIIADSNSIIKSISAAGGGALVGVNGAVSVNWIYSDTAAFIKNDTGINKSVTAKGDISLEAIDRSAISVIAGNISGGGLGAGASVAIVFIGNGSLENGDPAKNNQEYKNVADEFTYNQPTFTNDSKVRAFIENARLESTDGSVKVTAKENRAIFNISAGVAAGGAGWQGSVSVNYINAGISAYINKSDLEAKKDIKVQALTEARSTIPKSALQVKSESGEVSTFDGGANDEGSASNLETASKNSPEKLTNIQSVAGSVAGGGFGSVGIAIAVNYITNNYQAFVLDSVLKAGENIVIEAKNLAGIESVSAAAGAAGGESLGASVSFNLIENNILAYVTSSNLTVGNEIGGILTGGNIKLLASDNSTIKSVSGQVNFSGSQGLGAAAAYNQISNTIKAYVDKDSALAQAILKAGNNIEIQSKSASSISTIGASGSLASGTAGSATVIINIINNTVSAYISDANVTAGNNIYILAQSLNETNSYGGSLGGGLAVGIGAAAIVNVLNNDTEAYIISSTVIASGQGSPIAIPTWNTDGKKLSDQAVNGLIIIAYNQEAITLYSGTAGIGSNGASGQVSTNIIKNTTKAYIDSSIINNDTDKGELVIVKAIQDSGLQIYAGSLAVGFAPTGGAALGGAIDATVINNHSQAFIKDSTIYAGSGVEVIAITSLKPLTGEDKPALIIAGAALSNMLSLAGAVSLVVTDNTNEAYIENSNLYSLGSIKILSSHNIKMEVYGGTVAGSTLVGAGGTVIVSSFTNSSLAEIRGSDLNASGAIELLAYSRDDIRVKVGTAGVGGLAGVAGAVSVMLVETRTEASVIKDGARVSKLNQDTRFKPDGIYAPTNGENQLILIKADNETEVKTIAGSLGAGGLGVGAAVDYTSIQNRTVAMIGLASKVYATGDISLEALSEKIVDSQVYSAGGGLIGISGAVSIITVGTPISPEAAGEFNAGLKDQIDNDSSYDSWLYYKDDNGNRISRLPGDSIGSSAANSIKATGRPNLNNAIDPNMNTSSKITAAFVENASNQADRAELVAGGKVNIHAKNTNDLSSKADNTALGGAAVGGTVAYIFAVDNTHAYLGSYGYLRADNLAIKGETFIKAQALGEAVAGSLVGVNAYMAYAEAKPVTMAYIGDYADVAAAKNIQIDAETTPELSAEIKSNSVAVLGTAGASFAATVVEPVVMAYIGDHVHVVAASLPITGTPELTLINQAELTGNPNLDFRGYTIRIEGEFDFVRGIAMSGAQEVTFSKDHRTITRSGDGSWVTDGFSVGDTIVVSGTRRNNGEYVIKAISDKVLTLADGTVLTNETYDGQTKRQTLTGDYTLIANTSIGGGPSWTSTLLERAGGWLAIDDLVPGDEITVLAKINEAYNYYTLKVLEIKDRELTLENIPNYNMGAVTTSDSIEIKRIAGDIRIIAKGKEHDKLTYKGSEEDIWSRTNSRGEVFYDHDKAEGNFITVRTQNGTNDGIYQIIGLDGNTAILDTIGRVSKLSVSAELSREIPAEITRSEGNWYHDGFVGGQIINITGAANPANNGTFEILDISSDGRTLRLSKGLELVDDNSAGKNISLTSLVQNMITRDQGTWADDGFKVGQTIRLIGSKVGNDGLYTIQAISVDGKGLILDQGRVLTKEAHNQDLLIIFDDKYKSDLKINARLKLPQEGAGTTAQAKADGVSGGGLASSNGVIANVEVNPIVQAYVGENTILDISGDLEIMATALSKQRAEVDSTNIAGLAIAANNASVASSSKIQAWLGENTMINVLDFLLKAYGEEKNFAQAKTGSGGLASGALTKAETENKTQTLAYIGNGAQISAQGVAVFAEHLADYNSQVDTLSVSLVGGGGSLAENTVNADVKILIDDNAQINAYDILLAATNYSLKDWLANNEFNVKASAGAAANVSVAKSQTFIKHLTNIDIGAASLNVIGNSLFLGNLTLDAKNIIIARDKVKLDTAVGIGWARADSIIEAGNSDQGFNLAGINIASGADLKSVGDINLAALTIADVEARTNIKTAGAAPGADGKSVAWVDVENRIVIGGNLPETNLYAQGKINLLLGQDIFEGINSISAIATTDIDNRGVAPIYSDPDVDGIINLNNFITIGPKAILQSVSDTNLLIERGTTIASGKGVGMDWIKSALGAQIDVYKSTINMVPLIRVDGTIEVGIYCEQILIINQDGSIHTKSEGITIIWEKEILANHIMDEIIMLKSLAIEYAGTEAGEAFAAQVRFLEWELQQLGYDTSDGKPLPIEWIDIIIVGSIRAEQANLNIMAEDGSLIGTGSLNASTESPKIEIINHSPAYLKLGSLIIPEGQGGRLVFNYLPVAGTSQAQINEEINRLNRIKTANFTVNTLSTSVERPSITVKNTSSGIAGKRPPDIQLFGAVENIGSPGNPGIVWIESQGGISAYSSLDTGELHILAATNFVQSYTDSLFNVGGSPRAHWSNVAGSAQDIIKTNSYPWNRELKWVDGSLQWTWVKKEQLDSMINLLLAKPTEGVIRADNIFIAARYLNINGLIEAGSAYREINLAAEQNALANQYKEDTWNVIRDYNYRDFPLGNSCYYDPNTGRIIIEPIAVRGGYIELFGQIINTGKDQGRIVSLDGYGEIKVNNKTDFDIVIKGLDTGRGGSGVVIITDTSKKKPGTDNVYLTTKYERDSENDNIVITSWYTDNRNNIISTDTSSGREATYNPTEGYRFEWVMGQRMVERRIETYRSKSWLGIDWLAKDPENLYKSESWKDGEPQLMPEGEYLTYRPGNNEAGVAYSEIDYMYWYQYREDTAEKKIGYRNWSEQSWFMAPVWYYEEYTFQKGYIEVYYHSIRADYPIAIEFKGSSEGDIYIDSDMPVIIEGTIRNSTGRVFIKATEIIATGGGLIVSPDIYLVSGFGIGNSRPLNIQLGEGGVVSARTADGDIRLKEIAGTLTFDEIVYIYDTRGNVSLEAVYDIKGKDSSSVAQGNLVELVSSYGAIHGSGGPNSPLKIKTGNEEGQGLIAQAVGDINVSQSEGNLRVISLISENGDVSVGVLNGNLVDGNPDEFLGNAELLALWPNEKDSFTVQEILDFIEEAYRQQLSDTNYWSKKLNISAKDINLNIVAGAVGDKVDYRIDLENGQVKLTAEMATILAGAKPGEVSFYDGSANKITDLNRLNEATYLIVDLKRCVRLAASGQVNVQARDHIYLDSDQDLNLKKAESSSGQEIQLRSSGTIYNAADLGVATIRGGDLLLEAANGSIGSEANPLLVQLTGALIARAADSIFLESRAGGDFNIDYIYALNELNLQALGRIKAAGSSSGANIATHNLSMDAGSIGEPNKYLAINLLEKDGSHGQVNVEARAGGIYLEEKTGNLYLNSVSATADLILKAAKSIFNSSTDNDMATVSATKASLIAGEALGSPDNYLLLKVQFLEAEAQDGGIYLQNDGPLTIGDVSGDLAGLNAQGSIYLIVNKGITIKEDIIALNEIVIRVPDTVTSGDDILVTGGTSLESQNAYILLQAGDNLTLESGSLLKVVEKISLYIDYANADPGIGGIITLSGQIQAPLLFVEGGDDGDSFIIDSTLTDMTASIKGLGGDDIFYFADGAALEGTIDGGSGSDTLDYSAYQTDIEVDLMADSASHVTAGITSIENVIGGFGDDFIKGNHEDNTLRGGPGNDSLYGIGGNNILDGGEGNDHLEGGSGDDILITGSGHNTLIGGLGYDIAIIAAASAYSYEGDDIEEFITLDEGTNAYIVTFHANYKDGTVIPQFKIVYSNEKYEDLPELTRTGYTFKGWFTEESGGTEVTAATDVNISDTQRLYAQWTANEYTVSFNANYSGGGINPDTISVTYDEKYGPLPTLEERTGYTFAGWFTEAQGGTEVTSDTKVTIVGDQKLYAQWTINKYTIIFDSAGGTDVAAITQDYATSVTAPADPTRTGYTFIGWDTTVPTTMPAGDLTITAQWTINEYTITFDSAGGTDIAAITQNYATSVTAPADPTRTGYTFVGWDATVPTTMPAGGLTITAQWKVVDYDITYHLDGGTNDNVNPVNYTIETEAINLKAATKTGYTFGGWYSDAGFTTPVTEITKGSTEDVTLYAKWTINKYTITFDSAGGTDVAAITQDYATSVTAPADPTRTGYTFVGWDTTVPTTMSAGDLTITAQWTANKYEVTLESNGGTVEVASISVSYDGTYSELPSPSRLGYDFIGWFTESEGGTYISPDTPVTITEAQTLYARWTPAKLAGTVSLSGSGKYGETLTADTSDSTNNTGTLSYQWKRGDEDIEGATSDSYTLGLDDIGQVISCVVKSSIQTDYLLGTTINPIIKADSPAVTGVSKTDCTTVADNDGTLVGISGDMEYKLSTADSWIAGDGSIITGLTKGTYNVRIKETATHFAGSVSNFTIAAYSRPSSGGGGGGGGAQTPPSQKDDEDKGSDGPPLETQVPISGGNQELPIEVETSGNTTSVKPIDEAKLQEIMAAAKAVGKAVAIDLSSIDDRVDTALIPSGILAGVNQADAAGLEITMPNGMDVSFDKTALATLTAAGSGDMNLGVRNVPTDTLTPSERRLVGNARVIDLTAYVGEKQVNDFGGGLVTVSIPVSGQPLEHPIVWRMVTDAQGNVSLEAIECTYNPETNCYQFQTGTFSKYVISNYPFTDTPNSAWYYRDAVYAYVNGLLSGTTDTDFSPDLAMTRGMLVTILWRMENMPSVSASSFLDVEDGIYYADAVAWASAQDLVSGYSASVFGAEEQITREQMATILYRYAQYKGYDVSVGEDTNILSYNDALNISEYAIPTMQWACGAGLLQGSDGNLTPQGEASRAQVAAILHRFSENVAK